MVLKEEMKLMTFWLTGLFSINRIAQVDISNPLLWLAIFFVSGLAVALIVGIILGVILSLQGRRIRKRAAEAGVSVELPGSTGGFDPYDIEACGCCIGFFIIIILGALGISLPIILPQQTEALIMTVVLIIFGALFWGLVFWSILYTIRQYPKRQKLLEAALRGETPEDRIKKQTETLTCSTCGSPLRAEDKFCGNCGAATR